ncbi:MAG: protein-glutamate O-methyltransferase CheR [Nitrospinae bacterium]|nr:protein-glutamate O-methyltransferase CheR [Nitrospinota bacterium]
MYPLNDISPADYKLLADMVYDVTGLTFTGSQSSLFEKRIKTRSDAVGSSSIKEYYHYLKYDSNRNVEFKHLINLLTVNETYFFRENQQIETLIKEILPEIKARNENNKQIKIWSCASSTGCEPYTLAIAIHESKLFDNSWKVTIYGSDVNTEVLNIARAGVYTESAFRVVEPSIKNKYFTEKDEGSFYISDEIKKMVTFSQINMFNESQMKTMKDIDVIFCRNVLIYFNTESKKKVADSFYNSLNDNGYLFIGQSESLFKVTTAFKIKPMKGVMLYTKM